MLLRTLGRYALKLKMNNEFNGAGHFLGLDDSKLSLGYKILIRR